MWLWEPSGSESHRWLWDHMRLSGRHVATKTTLCYEGRAYYGSLQGFHRHTLQAVHRHTLQADYVRHKKAPPPAITQLRHNVISRARWKLKASQGHWQEEREYGRSDSLTLPGKSCSQKGACIAPKECRPPCSSFPGNTRAPREHCNIPATRVQCVSECACAVCVYCSIQAQHLVFVKVNMQHSHYIHVGLRDAKRPLNDTSVYVAISNWREDRELKRKCAIRVLH